ncbi:MAG: cytochrome c [Paracoccaceae bacterium]
MKLRTISAVSLAAMGFATLAIAGGHGQSAEDKAIGARNAQMELYSFNLGQLGAMAKGAAPYDAEVAAAAAANLAAVAQLDQSQFWPAETDNFASDKTRALPAIWSNMADFEAKSQALSDAAVKLAAAAGTDLDALKAGLGDVGGACSACHKAYRAPKN